MAFSWIDYVRADGLSGYRNGTWLPAHLALCGNKCLSHAGAHLRLVVFSLNFVGIMPWLNLIGVVKRRSSSGVEHHLGKMGVMGSIPIFGSTQVKKPGYPSGQRGQTVNLLTYVFVGSNPTPGTR